MIYDLPINVKIDGKEYKIRNNCDYRVVLDCIEALNDSDFTIYEALICAENIFYEEPESIENIYEAIKQMLIIINNGETEAAEEEQSKPIVMNWQKDFKIIAPAISRVLGYDIRTQDKFTHWYTFIGAYQEIGECLFANVVSIRNKLAKGKKLEKYEQEFYRENKKMVDLPQNLTKEEQEWLDSDW